MGTLRIGLDAIEADARRGERGLVAADRRSQHRPVRVVLAAALRRAAAALDSSPIGETAR